MVSNVPSLHPHTLLLRTFDGKRTEGIYRRFLVANKNQPVPLKLRMGLPYTISANRGRKRGAR